MYPEYMYVCQNIPKKDCNLMLLYDIFPSSRKNKTRKEEASIFRILKIINKM